MHKKPRILLDEGSGGGASQRLLAELFFRHFGLEAADMDDAALLYDGARLPYGLAMSTDSFTVDPLEFPGGDIGCLAVYGSVNDVAMLGARPEFLSCAFIMEEGLERELLERLVLSMARAATRAGVRIITGDTKVVPSGAADRLFINTTGIGRVLTAKPPRGKNARSGDAVLVSGSLGEHGLTIMAGRENLGLSSDLRSDCAPLNQMIEALLQLPEVHVLRDPTRGGLAATLNEIAGQSGLVCELEEKDIPIQAAVRDASAILGLDPLYLANEGKLVCILPGDLAEPALEVMRGFPEGAGAAQIGMIEEAAPGRGQAGQVILRTGLGGRRLLAMPEGAQLPRIC